MATNEDRHAIAARRAKDDPRHDWSFYHRRDGRRLWKSRVSGPQLTGTVHTSRINIWGGPGHACENFTASARR
jgi:hypothetical protein